MPAPSDSLCARASLFALGAGAIAVQLVCLREVMSTFGGNELIVGVALGLWLVATGIGSGLGALLAPRLPPLRGLFSGHVLIALLPLAMLAGVRAIPALSGVRGEMLGPRAALVGCLLVFLPFGLVSGGMIPLATKLLGERTRAARDPGDLVRRAYVFDSAGSAFGGLLFSLLLVQTASHGGSLTLFGWINLCAAFLLALRGAAIERSRVRVLGAAVALLLSAVALAGASLLDRATAGWRFPGQTIVLRRDTPFAQLTVTQSGTQENVYQDAIPLYSSGDLGAEARVHPPLSQVPLGAEVLLVGGGVFGGLREAAKHAPARIDYVELDPAIFTLSTDAESGAAAGAGRAALHRDSSAVSPGNIHRHATDGRAFIQAHRSAFDAILLDLPGPQNAGLNRYYTAEFFRLAAAALKPGGVLSFTLAASPNYLGEEQLALERSIHAALRGAFQVIEVLPGETHVVIAANRPLALDVPDVLAARGIETERLLDYDWHEMSDPFRREELAALLSVPAASNRDLAPAAFGQLVHREARKSGTGDRLFWILAAASAIGLFLASGLRSTGIAVGTTGFAAMALELEIFLLFQVLFGHLYLRLSLFATLFLVGAAAGAWVSPRLRTPARRQIAAADGVLVLLSALLALYAWRAPSVAGNAAWTHQGALCAFILLVAAATGAQFAAAGATGAARRDSPDRVAAPHRIGRLYLADLAGAASGTVITGLILLPRAGIAGATLAILAVKGTSLLFQALPGRSG